MEVLPEKNSDSELALTENMELQELSTLPLSSSPPVNTSTPSSAATILSSPPEKPPHRKVSVRFKTSTSEQSTTTEPSTLTILETEEENNQELEENVQEQKIETIELKAIEVEDENEDKEEEKNAKSASAPTKNLSGILRKVGSSLIGRPTGPTPPGGTSPFVSTFVTGRAESTSTLERFIFNLVIIAALMMLMGIFLGGRYLWYRWVDWI